MANLIFRPHISCKWFRDFAPRATYFCLGTKVGKNPLGDTPQPPTYSLPHRSITGACSFALTPASATRSPLRSALPWRNNRFSVLVVQRLLR